MGDSTHTLRSGGRRPVDLPLKGKFENLEECVIYLSGISCNQLESAFYYAEKTESITQQL